MKKLIILSISIAFSLLAMPQNFLNNVDQNKAEVGIDTKLDDTIPMSLNFINEKGDSVQLGDLITKPTVFSFVYFDCPGLCSPLLDGVSDVISKTDMVLGQDFDVITISFNYRDTPEKAKGKKENFIKNISKESAEHWRYLTADSATINTMLNSVGFKVKPTGFDFMHPSAIILVSPKGKITRYLYGVTFLPFDLKMAIIEAQQGISRPTISRVLKFCFSYDPKGQQYVVDITKMAGLAITIGVIIIFLGLVLSKKKKVRK